MIQDLRIIKNCHSGLARISSVLKHSLNSCLSGVEGSSGQSLIELLITIGLIAVIIPALLTGFVAARSGRAQQEQRMKATALLREGQEAVRTIREFDWTAFAALTSGYPCRLPSSNTWSLCSGSDPAVPAGFSRTIQISSVFRDATTDAIVAVCVTGCYNDPSTKLVTTTVSWTNPIPSSINTTEYLTRNGNLTLTQSGSAQPPSGGNGNWCNPSTGIVGTPYNLGAIPIAITATTQTSNDSAFVSTGNNRSSGSPVFGLSISHASTPGVSPSGSSFDNAKAYGIFSDGTYVYFTEANPGVPVRIASASNLSNVGFFGPNGTNKGPGSVFIVGVGGTANAKGYAAIGNRIYSFNLSTIVGSSTQVQIDSKAISGNAQKLIVFGSKAYVVTDSTSNQLQIFPISGGTFGTRQDVNLEASLNLAGVDLAVDPTGHYAYIITNFATGKNDFFVVDLTDTTKIYKYTTNIVSGPGAGNMNPRGVASVTNNKVILVGCNANNGPDSCPVNSSGWIYQVFDFDSGPASGNRCGGMTPTISGNPISGINAVAGVSQSSGNVFSYIVSGANSTSQFQIIQGGAGSGGGSGNGITESTTFDAGHTSAFNYFTGTTDPDLSYKIAIKEAVGGVCPSFVDGDFVAISTGAISLPGVGYTNPGQCMRYRVINSGTGVIPYTVTVSYSP